MFYRGRQGTAEMDPDVPGTDLIPLFDEHPCWTIQLLRTSRLPSDLL